MAALTSSCRNHVAFLPPATITLVFIRTGKYQRQLEARHRYLMPFVYHLRTQSLEAVIDLKACACTAFHIYDFTVLSLEFLYLSTGYLFRFKVTFVPNNHDGGVNNTRIHFDLLHPLPNVVEGRLSSEVKDADEALSPS